MRALSKLELSDLDERLVHQYHIPNAVTTQRIGKALRTLVAERYPSSRRIVVLAGAGNTGGTGLAVARLLHESGVPVRVVLSRPELFLKPTTKQMFDALPADLILGVSEEASDDELRDLLYGSNLLIDALLGYPLASCPYGECARLIDLVNESGVPVLSVDVPSGFDADAGLRYERSVRADATLSHVLPRKATEGNALQASTGSVYVCDVGVPDAWFKQEEIERPDYDPRGLLQIA